MRLLFKGGHYYAQPGFFAAPIRGRRLFGVRRLFKEIRSAVFGHNVHSAEHIEPPLDALSGLRPSWAPGSRHFTYEHVLILRGKKQIEERGKPGIICHIVCARSIADNYK